MFESIDELERLANNLVKRVRERVVRLLKDSWPDLG